MKLEKLIEMFGIIKGNPDVNVDAAGYSLIASNLFEEGRLDLSKELMEIALKRKKTDANLIVLLSSYYFEFEKDMGKAINILEDARSEGPTNHIVFGNLRFYYSKLENREKEIEVLEEARAKDQIDSNMFLNLGVCYDQSGNLDEAINILEDARSKNKTNPDVFHNLGVYYSKKKDLEKAIEVLEDARSKNQANQGILQNLDVFYQRINNIKKDIEVLEDARSRNLTIPATFRNLGILYCNVGEIEKAIDVFEEAKTRNQIEIPVLHNLGACYHYKGQLEKAAEIWSHAISIGQAKSDTFVNLSSYYNQTENPREAKKILLDAISKGKTNSLVFHLLHKMTGDSSYFDKIKEIASSEDNKDYLAYVILSDYPMSGEMITVNYKPFFLQQMVRQMKKNGEFQSMLGDYKKATNTIKVIRKNPLLSPLIVVKEGEKSFDKEKELRDKLDNVVGGKAKLPIYIDNFEDKGKHYYIMEREQGITLTDLINIDKVPEKIYKKVLEVMANLHVLMPTGDFQKYDFGSNVRNKIENSGLSMGLVENIKPVTDVLDIDCSNIGYSKDSFTDNWMILRNNKLLVVDTADRGLAPYAAEVAHFLNCIPFYKTVEERVNATHKYIDYVNDVCRKSGKQGKVISDTDFFLKQYHNAVIYRAIDKIGYYGGLSRLNDVKQVSKAGVDTIDFMGKHNLMEKSDIHHYNAIQKELAREVK